MNYRITTDTTCDLPVSFYTDHRMPLLGLTCRLDTGREFTEGAADSMPLKEFYQYLRDGGSASTMQMNAWQFCEAIEPLVAAGEDVLHIAFSGGLSGTYQSCVQGAVELREKYPDRRIEVVDSLCASMGEALLVTYALHNQQNGMSLDENLQWLEENKLNLAHWFTVDDLMFLHRGGRVSKSSAILGSLIGIKPILHVDDEGHLILVGKKRGRKASIEELANRAINSCLGELKDQPVFICHGDCEDDANTLADMLRERAGVENIVIQPIGTVIGSHSGPGTLAVFFMADKR
ncbi:MAG: DegV family protein [Clostridia bacterium]|nr:DegV family protein [Clostridia bacterium]